ncbi:MAG: hypothetical protein SPL86_09615 [Succiniclasticum sp.]|uniref:hypothetical protein n=1 Tax=Succiniclasticum sp. TaxID=2775030 RepID=UPI002A91C496|nr:hypothetical protein [Succiniclasticum sp.]MDY6291726.1 hypothetical protein [Succiniclasticum sp.]
MMDEKEKLPEEFQAAIKKMQNFPLEKRIFFMEKVVTLLVEVIFQNFRSYDLGTKTVIEAQLEIGIGKILKDL